jgi:hypothetical protein
MFLFASCGLSFLQSVPGVFLRLCSVVSVLEESGSNSSSNSSTTILSIPGIRSLPGGKALKHATEHSQSWNLAALQPRALSGACASATHAA